jgi:hypothetical protein
MWEPTGLAIAPDTSIYVADYGNNRVQRFDNGPGFLMQWSMPPAWGGGPVGITVDQAGQVWVAWTSGGDAGFWVIIYDPNGVPVKGVQLKPEGDVELRLGDMVLDKHGLLMAMGYYPATGQAALLSFDEDGNEVDSVELPAGADHFALLDDGSVVVAGSTPDSGTYLEMVTARGASLLRWGDGAWAVAHDMLAGLRQVAFDAEGCILAAGGFSLPYGAPDPTSQYLYLHRYTAEGDLVAILYSSSDPEALDWYFTVLPDGQMVRSTTPIASDGEANTYVLLDVNDMERGRVRKTDSTGSTVAEWDTGPRAVNIVVGMDGLLYVDHECAGAGIWDGMPHWVDLYTLDGAFLRTCQTGHNGMLHAVDPGGQLYTSSHAWEGWLMEKRGATGFIAGTITAADGEAFGSISAAALNPEGKLAVADGSHGRVHVFAISDVFGDVPWWHWARDSIAAIASAGITFGYPDGNYHPAELVTRAQVAVYLARAIADGGMPPAPSVPTFSDVPMDHWAYDYVEFCASEGVAEGYLGAYYPDQVVDRAQMSVFLARAMVGGEDHVPAPPQTPRFADVTAASPWAWCYPHVEYLASEGVTRGYADGLYHPERLCSRDQMAVYVQRAFALPL